MRHTLALRASSAWRGVRGSPAQAAALAAALAAAVVAAAHVPDRLRAIDASTRAAQSLSKLDRQLLAARSFDAETRFFVEAQRLLPPDAIYHVVTGSGVRVSTPITLHAIRPFASFWLLPRRQTPDVAEAGWVLSYGGDLGSLHLRYRRVVDVGPGLELAEVAR